MSSWVCGNTIWINSDRKFVCSCCLMCAANNKPQVNLFYNWISFIQFGKIILCSNDASSLVRWLSRIPHNKIAVHTLLFTHNICFMATKHSTRCVDLTVCLQTMCKPRASRCHCRCLFKWTCATLFVLRLLTVHWAPTFYTTHFPPTQPTALATC